MSFTIRPVTEEDFGALQQLQESVWFPVRSEAGWRWLFQENPDQGDLPGGLVYADNDTNDVGAFIGMTRLAFMRAGEELFGGFGHTLIARPGTGGAGLRLAAGTTRRLDGFAAYTLNNNEYAIPVYKALHGRPLHPESASKTAYWVTNPWLYIKSGFGRRIHSFMNYKFATKIGERMANLKPPPADLELPEHVKRIEDPLSPSSDLSEFANRLGAEDFITSRRDHTRLRWKLSDPDQSQKPLMWIYDRGDGVEGWLIARVTKESEIAAPTLTIIDLISLSSSTHDALPALVDAAIDASRSMGAARLLLPHFTPETAEALKQRMQDGVVRETYPHAHILGLDMTASEIEKCWRTSPFDGDYFFALRQPPSACTDR